MIKFYSGTPGAGKSFHVAKEIHDSIISGKNVIANFYINYELIKPRRKFFKTFDKGYFFEKDNFELSAEWLIDFAKICHKVDKKGRVVEGQTIIVIDECQLIFNARSWQVGDRQRWIEFFTQHRKLGYDVILISQFDRLVDRQIRSLIEYEFKHRKANNFGFFGGFLGLFTFGKPVFAVIKYWYCISEKVGVSFLLYSSKYSRLYDSYKLF